MDTTGTFWMPPGASTVAGSVDALFYFIYWASVAFFVIVVGLAIFFAIRYRRRPGRETATSHQDVNIKLEIIWTAIPLILVTIVFAWGFRTYMEMQIVPRDAVEIKVTGRQWMWLFDYPNGKTAINELVVPEDTPIKLLMSSEDVIHSFYIPQFRVKKDVVPNRYTITWFEATTAGTYDLYCAEFCGDSHSEMLATVEVVSQDEYASYLEGAAQQEGGGQESLVSLGQDLYTARACNTCHSLDGSPNVGPTFQNLYGHEVELSDGSTVTADENYIRQSILEPSADIVQGYQAVMPTYQGLLSEREIDGIIAYLKSISDVESIE
ncbi:MAG: cytochrome c oxidase subunit II [Candidatus Marinimicrobia bacterium]|nr:cytochrome c oxidase subunit II [Candidatus Neomarinimicrobiota bacterium]